jgi:lipoate-protein ligase A
MEQCDCEFDYKCIKCGKTQEESIKAIKSAHGENLTFQDVMDILNLRFKSGNGIPVTRSRIDSNEWEILREYIQDLKRISIEYNKMFTLFK